MTWLAPSFGSPGCQPPPTRRTKVTSCSVGEAAPREAQACAVSLIPRGHTTWPSSFTPVSETEALLGKGLGQGPHSAVAQPGLTRLPDSATDRPGPRDTGPEAQPPPPAHDGGLRLFYLCAPVPATRPRLRRRFRLRQILPLFLIASQSTACGRGPPGRGPPTAGVAPCLAPSSSQTSPEEMRPLPLRSCLLATPRVIMWILLRELSSLELIFFS